MSMAAVVVEDPSTPAWQRLSGLSRPTPRSGLDVSVAVLLLVAGIVMLMCGAHVPAAVLLVSSASMAAYRAVRSTVSQRRSVTVWSTDHVTDLLLISDDPECTGATLWDAALSPRRAHVLASRCF